MRLADAPFPAEARRFDLQALLARRRLRAAMEEPAVPDPSKLTRAQRRVIARAGARLLAVDAKGRPLAAIRLLRINRRGRCMGPSARELPEERALRRARGIGRPGWRLP